MGKEQASLVWADMFNLLHYQINSDPVMTHGPWYPVLPSNHQAKCWWFSLSTYWSFIRLVFIPPQGIKSLYWDMET